MKTILSKKHLDFLIHWANECIQLGNPHYSISFTKNEQGNLVFLYNGAPEVKTKEESKEWLDFFSGMCKEGLLLLLVSSKNKTYNYTFKSHNAINDILKLEHKQND